MEKKKQKSWLQSYPVISIQLIEELNLAKDAPIIDVGGGDSLLVDAPIEKGYTDIIVLDISEVAITNAQKRLGNKAHLVTWVISDCNRIDILVLYKISDVTDWYEIH